MYNKCYCSDFIASANLLHTPAVQTARGGEKRVLTLSQCKVAQIPVDALNVLRPWLSALACGRHNCRRDKAGSTVATAGQQRALADEARSWRRTERGRGERRRHPAAPNAFSVVLAST